MARILSVEDDADLQHLLSSVLRNQGHEVHYAFTGPEGFEKAVALNPDLILLDMMLPGYNGAEVASRLKATPATRDIPIIVLTAYQGRVDFFESAAKAAGVVEYLRKPVQFDELIPLIKRILRDRRGRAPFAVWKRGVFRMAPDTRSVWVDGRLAATLPPKRFEVLFHLLQSRAEVAWKELVFKVWGRGGSKNDLEKTIERLRKDLGADGFRLTTTRRGYQLLV